MLKLPHSSAANCFLRVRGDGQAVKMILVTILGNTYHVSVTVLCINLFNPDNDPVREVQLLSSFDR